MNGCINGGGVYRGVVLLCVVAKFHTKSASACHLAAAATRSLTVHDKDPARVNVNSSAQCPVNLLHGGASTQNHFYRYITQPEVRCQASTHCCGDGLAYVCDHSYVLAQLRLSYLRLHDSDIAGSVSCITLLPPPPLTNPIHTTQVLKHARAAQ